MTALRGDAQPARDDASALASLTSGIERAKWTWLGPGNIGGRVRTIAASPLTGATLFAGAAGGGIWTSADGGDSWQAVNDFLPSLSVGTIIFRPTVPTTLFAGTGDGLQRIAGALPGAGIFVSTDAGVNWAQLASTVNADFAYVNKLAMSADGATLLAGTSTGLWRSTNQGASWVKVLTPTTPFADIADVKFLTASSTHAVASGFSSNAYYSTNGGATWTVSTQPARDTVGNLRRIVIAVAGPDNPNVVYLSHDHASTNSGRIWRSTNGGQQYIIGGTPGHLNTSGSETNAIWVDPRDNRRIVFGGIDLFRSTDSGTSWIEIAEWKCRCARAGTEVFGPHSLHPGHHAIVGDPNYNGTTNTRVFFGNDAGVAKTEHITTASISSTTDYVSLNHGLGVTEFYSGAITASGKFVGGTKTTGTVMSATAGATQTWTTVKYGAAGFVAADPVNANIIYGENEFLSIHRSLDGGVSSAYIYGDNGSAVYDDQGLNRGTCKAAPFRIDDACPDVLPGAAVNFVAPFILDPTNANTLLAGGQSLWRTNNVKAAVTATTGPTWAAIKPPSPAGCVTTACSPISAIAVAPANAAIIWVGHNNGDVYMTTNGTAGSPSWTKVDTALPDRAVTRVVITASNPAVVYATFDGASANNIWRTTSSGASWSSIGASLTVPIRALAINPTQPTWLYAGASNGVYASADAGVSWHFPHDGPANVAVEDLFWRGSTLIAATRGRGMFAFDTTRTCTATITPTQDKIEFAASTNTVAVTAAAGCAWSAVSNDAFLTVVGGANGSGNGTVTYTSTTNPTTAARIGTLTIAGLTFTVTQTGNAISLSPTTLTFGGVNNGGTLSPVTPAQNVTVLFAGAGTTNWSAAADQPWVRVTNGTGTGNGRFTVEIINPGNILAGAVNVSANIRVSATNAGNSPQTTTVQLRLFAPPTSAPFGSMDTPINGATGVTGSIGVTGWALDDIGVAGVKIYRNCLVGIDNPASCQAVNGSNVVFIGDAAFLAGARPDVEGLFPTRPRAYAAGWGYLMLTNMLPHVPGRRAASGGQGPLTILAFATDFDGHRVLLGQKAINLDNDHGNRPFGAIDTPTQGANVSGTLTNFGWALTPGSAMIPTTGSTMNVVVDGVAVGKVAYNQCRAGATNVPPAGTCHDDIATLFPGYTNITGGSGAIGSFIIDTRAMSNGLHTIAWGVIDNQNRNDGIGSRFFTVLNGSSSLVTSPSHTAALAAQPAKTLGRAADLAWRAPSTAGVSGRTGFDFEAPVQAIVADSAGVRHVTIPELGRVELQLGDDVVEGYLEVNGALRALPPGSKLDAATGQFTWAPGPGFIGSYDLRFLQGTTQLPVRVTIRPKPSSISAMRGVIDLPGARATVSSAFTVAGWALDANAWQGAGVDAVHVWALRRNAAGAVPVFLGAAAVGGARPDVAAAFGPQFDRAGWTVTTGGLASGIYDVTAYFWSTRTARFEDARTVTITVR